MPYGSGAFGFVDPLSVVHGCFLLPTFSHGRTKELLMASKYYDDELEGDWKCYYAMMYASSPATVPNLDH